MVGVQEVFHIKKIIQKLKKKNLPLFMNGMDSWIFFRTSLAPSITYILVIKIGWTVFEKIRFFHFFKFVHNFCKKIFFELILKENLSCNCSHLPSQYGSNPSGGTQTILISLRPLSIYISAITRSYPVRRLYLRFKRSLIDPRFCKNTCN